MPTLGKETCSIDKITEREERGERKKERERKRDG
jgi:hypothetical protein